MGTIFVCTAAFNETDLEQTIETAFNTAKFPNNVYFGIALQYPDNELPNLSKYKNVKTIEIKGSIPYGTSSSRALAAKLKSSQDYFLSIDAHTIFKKNWDETLIEELAKLKAITKTPIITTYAPFWYRDANENIINQTGSSDLDQVMPIMPLVFITKEKERNSKDAVIPAPDWGKPLTEDYKEHHLVSAHFLFADMSFIEDVPFDPSISYYEENTTALRAWTRGYRMFAVNKDVLWTREMFHGKQVKNSWRSKTLIKSKNQKDFNTRLAEGNLRVKHILTGEILGIFGAPTLKSIEEYEKAAGIDYKKFYKELYLTEYVTSKISGAVNTLFEHDSTELSIEFVTETPDDNSPIPAVKSLPDWYKKAKKYQEGKVSSFKNCVPFFEAISSGYVFLLPCDVKFYQKDGEPFVELPQGYEPLVTKRRAMKEFHTPDGYYDVHFAWLPNWGVKAPIGYNVLYLTPLNNYALPFINTSGIINSDKVNQPGSVPFFLRNGFEGVIPKGTPYIQIIPIKRESWKHREAWVSYSELEYFVPGTPHIQNYYRDNLWEMSRYD
jgi:hypothetical protein